MDKEDKCSFRYYEIMPLEIEPEYKLGYTCDMCSRDFARGPFFHCAKTGKDLCVNCGGRQDLSPFSTLISKVMFPNVLWKDIEKEALVVLCYQIHIESLGCHFSDGSNLLISLSDNLPSYYIDSGSSIEKATLFFKNEIYKRFPWIKEIIKAWDTNSVTFHALSKRRDRSRLCFLNSFRQEGGFIGFLFSDGFSQVLHCNEGITLLVKNSIVLSYLVMNSPFRWGKVLPKSAESALEWYINGN